MNEYLHTYLTLDMGVGVIVNQLEVVVVETEDVLFIRIDKHSRQGFGRAGELQAALVDMVVVNVGIA